ncbi:hypothetical protein GOPIP_009_00810 [Gordonia polyisoprenivorans NBRC 16320 = JCM 10675]|uniref:DUF1684 domain-containing protein n=1 Tax=Gordonia polyisoprenivorans TaxID=84595 RepID=A0A846WTU4_9ACTN|nr:DUF1684 domain-containing protein [Gordonia polyisoprenivorans]NKY04093.1 DUF1684 domain-containing protein [Gordonia polyisoprenivorans]UZF53999.1 DUF1684 domain-containing protein [Gordonia polyisoprenivorans]GAB21527.1 hypothetical protein GOPIP_009_00810 [Gordonia polyisoprenivorans NBRC 16320 = JCM 10675]
MTETLSTDADFAEQWHEWHTARERDLANPLGWLSINRLEWLETEPARFDGLPGTWWYDGATGHLRPNGGETFAARDFDLDATGAGEIVELDGVHLEVARRGDGYLIRVHDENAPTVRDFRGVPTYEPDPSWALSATFEPYSTPRPVTVGAVAEGLAHVYVSPGELVLTRDGADHRLIAFNGKAGGLSVLFTDGTSGVTTYAANRSVAIEADDEVVRSGGEVIIDFNRATNLPCAFIDFATCPLPPAGNTLPFDVTAGEKIPHERA